MQKLTFRKARKTESAILAEFISALFSIEKDFVRNIKAHRTGISKLMDDKKNAAVFVAVKSGHIIGMATGQFTISTAAGGRSLLIEDFIISKEYRGKGIGEKLLKVLISWGIRRGAKRAHLLADEQNHKAIKFYGKNSFSLSRMRAMYRYL